MGTSRTQSGKTAPESECGFFMPKFSPASLGVPKFQEGRGVFYLTHLNAFKASFDTKRTLRAIGYMLSEVLPMPGGNRNTPLESNSCAKLGHPRRSSHSQPLSLFLSGSVIDSTKGVNSNEINGNRLSNLSLERSERSIVAFGRPFGADSIDRTLRQETARPCFPNHEPLRFDEPNQADAVGMGRREDGSEPGGPGSLAKNVSVSAFRPDAVIWAYWLEVVNVEQDAELMEVEYLEAI